MHEGTNALAQLHPKWLSVELRLDPSGAAQDAFLDQKRQAAYGNVFEFVREVVRATRGARAPANRTVRRECAQAIQPERVEPCISRIVDVDGQTGGTEQLRVVARR